MAYSSSQILGTTIEMPTLHCDNHSAIMLTKNPIFHAKTKNIEVKYHFIRDMLEDKLIRLVKVHTNDNPIDLLAKGSPPERIAHCQALMGVKKTLYCTHVQTNVYNYPTPLKAHCPLSERWGYKPFVPSV